MLLRQAHALSCELTLCVLRNLQHCCLQSALEAALGRLRRSCWIAGHREPEQHFVLAHGHIHGVIEGRALGTQKGFELWEEVAFYRSFANVWLLAAPRDGNALEDEKSR